MSSTYLWGLNPTFEVIPNDEDGKDDYIVKVKVIKKQKDEKTYSFTILVIPNGKYKIHKKTFVLASIYKDKTEIYSSAISYTLIDKEWSMRLKIPEGTISFSLELNKDYISESKIVIPFFNGSAIGPTYWFKLGHKNIKTEKKINPKK